MSKQELIRNLNLKYMKKSVPIIRTWYTVKVVTKFKEWDKERSQSFEWLVIKINWKYWDVNNTITVRKISEWVWVEKIFPIHSPNVASIEIIKTAKVRRAKLYYMRDRFWKSARLKEIRITQAKRNEMIKNFDDKDKKAKDETVKEENIQAIKEPASKEVTQKTNEVKTENIKQEEVKTEAESK